MANPGARGLGRGLVAMLDPSVATQPYVQLPVDRVEPNPRQPRRTIDPEALGSLTRSIAADGVVQPVVVRERPDGRYELIAGERRWRAAVAAGLTTIPARGPQRARPRRPAARHRRERRPRRPERGRDRARLRGAGRRLRADGARDRRARRAQPQQRLQHPAPARAARRRAGADRRAAPSARATAAPSCRSTTPTAAAPWPAGPPPPACRCGRPRRSRGAAARPAPAAGRSPRRGSTKRRPTRSSTPPTAPSGSPPR